MGLAYRFTWRNEQMGALGERALAGQVAGEANVSGTLFVAVSSAPGGARVVARLADVRVHAWQVAELELAEQDVSKGAAVLDPDATGTYHDVAFAAETTPGARMLLRAVLSHALHHAPPGPTAAADERTSIGTAATDFVWTSPSVLVARRVRYLSLDAVALLAPYAQEVRSREEWAFAGDGAPRHVHEEEHVVLRAADGAVRFASALSFDLERAEEGGRAVAALPKTTTREPLDGTESEDTRRERLVRRVDGLTEARLHDRVTIAANGGGPETDAKLLFRATGLLLLEPGAAGRLADRLLAGAGGAGAHGDELVVDLLTFAGDEASQAALLRVLGDRRVRDKAVYPLLVQRLGLLAAPSRAVAAFSLALAREAPAGSDLAIGAHYMLGAIAGRLARGADTEGAEPLLQELEARLARADTEAAKVHALAAIGNAGAPRHAQLVAANELTKSPSAEVRRAAAGATRAFLDAGTLAAAFALAADADAGVAEAAVRALGERPLTPDDRARLSRLAREGAIPPGAAAAVVEVMRLQPPPEADARATLATLSVRHAEEPALRARIAALAVELGAPAHPPEEIR